MRLKSLKLAGFKSFANPTTFTFKHDITAIVGPNGCGKSNVIDAIRWVLGETSAKQLRGGAMSDVIFAGVEGRAGKSLASVELTFEHTQDEGSGIRHALNLYHELTLRRQVSKDGKSDYFINGQRVRRRDVVDVFLGTGLGARSYAVIEQGMIGRIVESSPMELRAFIEEAAGVSRYQARRAETQKQLDDTRENLERLSDLQSELKKQHKTLIRQAESAKKYEALNAQLMALNKNDLLKRIFEAWQYLENKKNDKQLAEQLLNDLDNKVHVAKQELDNHAQKVSEANWLKDDARDKYHDARMKEQTAEHQFLTLSQELSALDDKIHRLTELKNDNLASTLDNQKAIFDIDEELTKIAPDLLAYDEALLVLQSQLQNHQQEFNTARQTVHDLTSKKHELDNAIKLATAQKNRLLVGQEKWTKKHEQLLANEQNLTLNHDEEVDKIDRLTKEINLLSLSLNELDELAELGEDKRELDRQNELIKTHQNELAVLEKRHASLMGEYETLHKLIHKPKTTNDAHANHELAKSFYELDTLQDKIELTKTGEAYADVLDKFLGFWLDARIGEGNQVLSIINHVPNAKDKQEINLILTPKRGLQETGGELIPLNALIKTPSLALWQGVYLWEVDTAGFTDEDFAKLGDEWEEELSSGVLILTKTGWLIGAFGVMHMSRFGQGQGVLTERTEHAKRLAVLEEELNELEGVLTDKERALKAQMSEVERLSVVVNERTAKRNATAHRLHEAKAELASTQHKISQDKLKQENFNTQKQALDEERADIERELSGLDKEIQAGEQALHEHLPTLTLAQNTLSMLTTRTHELTTKVQEQSQAKQALALRHATLTQNKTHALRLLELAQNNLTQADNDMMALIAQSEASSAKLPVLESAFKTAKAQTAELKIASEEHEAIAKTLAIMQGKLQENLTHAHANFATAQADIANAHADVAVGESRVADLGEQMRAFDEHFNLSKVLADFAINAPQFEDNTAKIHEIKSEIDKLGAVNLMAMAELSELESRVSPLDEQVADISQSMKKLQDAIRAIDNKTKELFLSMLSAVNGEMNALFAKVFGGGQASLTLIDDDSLSKADKWRAGLVLMAQPKGKKNSRLAVLSGGEKTLTALSLIFAIFKQHPAPFCVLDEVDAPLDDANVGRFTSLIHELAHSVQFIFISHNKLAMQTAHELKGITMPTAGISSLVTVNLEEAEKYLEQA